MQKTVYRYSFNHEILNGEVCSHDIFYIVEKHENDGTEEFAYIMKCLYCGKTIYEKDFNKPVPYYSINSIITLEDGQELFIPYEQVKHVLDKYREKYKVEYGKEPDFRDAFELLANYYGQKNI